MTMKLVLGVDLYDLPADFGAFALVKLKGDDAWEFMETISSREMVHRVTPTLGRPTHVATFPPDGPGAPYKMRVHPAPNASYELDITYAPRMRKL